MTRGILVIPHPPPHTLRTPIHTPIYSTFGHTSTSSQLLPSALTAVLIISDFGMMALELKMMLLWMDPPKVVFRRVMSLEISMLREYLKMFLGYSGSSSSPMARSRFLLSLGKQNNKYSVRARFRAIDGNKVPKFLRIFF